jgi:ABC-type transport system involved in multi-copper enzyme maturation permease subunit
LIWVTWRQLRVEGYLAAVAVALLAASILLVTYELSHSGCTAGDTGGICTNDAAGLLATWILNGSFDSGWGPGLITYGLVLLPALAGTFVGAPLLAREFENGTHRLAWTQGVTRMRWLVAKLTLLFLLLLGAAAALGILEVKLVDAMGTRGSHWGFFDQQAPLIIGSTAFALALGAAAGAVLGRSVPAIAVALIGFSATRFAMATSVRAYYMSPKLFTTHDPNALNGSLRADPTAWLVNYPPEYHDAAGRALNYSQVNDQLAHAGNQSAANYFTDHGITLWHYYQPADRFWTFQMIETTILIVAAVLLLGVTAYWVARRAS